MQLVSVSSKTSYHWAWVYDIRYPLGKVHFKRPGPLALRKKLRDPGLLVGGESVWSGHGRTRLLTLDPNFETPGANFKSQL